MSARPDWREMRQLLMSGIDAAKFLRALPHGKSITLVALTGWGHEHDRQRTRAAEFDAHLLKSVDSAQLDKLLAEPVARAMAV